MQKTLFVIFTFFSFQVSKLIDDATVSKLKTAIHSERILDFLVEKRVLAIALEGNIIKRKIFKFMCLQIT